MDRFTTTSLWQKTLAPQSISDPAANARNRLHSAFLNFRERAKLLAAEIARSMPDFTVHDITHLDALWEMADLIAGPNVYLTPTEGFVLGGAILIHDLGMGLAAYPEGMDALRKQDRWTDVVVALLRAKLGRAPSAGELEHPDADTERQATEQFLRDRHAEQAARLALISWKDQHQDEEYYLIEDPDLRSAYGSLIGRIAHSHWWPVDRLNQAFPAVIGAPGTYPNEWTVDPLKLACLLRTADAAHLDDRRSPGFLRAIRKPAQDSRRHWVFQENLNQPYLDADRLLYTSKRPFPIDQADAWWECFDALQMVDRELRQADSLLADSGRQRLAARGVVAAGEHERLVRLIQVEGWVPVDARVKVSDVAALARKIGGEQLYGSGTAVPLRELIQNAADAVRARRMVEERPDNWGRITVRVGRDSEGEWVEVEDTGIGMSADVLAGPFLDFGASYWGSGLMLQELPGLLSKGFQPTGQYGIGFFSVFMWGDHVRVTTRRYDEALQDTRVLEFRNGLTSRPLMRKAGTTELVQDGGTRVRVWLSGRVQTLEDTVRFTDIQRLDVLCAWLCPSLDVDLYVTDKGAATKRVVGASDWITLPGRDMLDRVWAHFGEAVYLRQPQTQEMLGDNLRLLRSPSGEVIGRACVMGTPKKVFPYIGIVTVGGFRSEEIVGLAGIFAGTSLRTTRNHARPFANGQILADWATEQATLVSNAITEPVALEECAQFVRVCGGDVCDLPIAYSSRGWMTASETAAWHDAPAEMLFASVRTPSSTPEEQILSGEVTLCDNVLLVTAGYHVILNDVDWPQTRQTRFGYVLEHVVLEALSQA